MMVAVGLVVEINADRYSCLGEGVRDGRRLNMVVMNMTNKSAKI